MILITTLAEYQTAFWAAVGEELRRRRVSVGFLSFDDRSSEMLRTKGFETWAVTAQDLSSVDGKALETTFRQFNIDNINLWCSHERVTFGIRCSEVLAQKLAAYLRFADRTLMEILQRGDSVILVQELGGFLSVIASFFAARHRNIDNYFIEPAFFRGRMFFLRNSFAAPVVRGRLPDAVSPEVASYIKETVLSGSIVIPMKDRHQYKTAFRKVVNIRNVKRLLQKLLDKYLYGKRQEFGHIRRHVTVHVSMLVNSLRLRSQYTDLSRAGRFVYYPLHVPGDMALTLRSPQFLDQLALIDYLVRIVPQSHKVAIKEHPAMIGAVSAARLIELMRRYDNLILLPPSTNNYQALRAADAVVSVNSKSGAEATLLGKPVYVLGDAFYRESPLVVPVRSLTDLPEMLSRTLSSDSTRLGDEDMERYFELVWRQCLPGELYVERSENVRTFVDSLLSSVDIGRGPEVAM